MDFKSKVSRTFGTVASYGFKGAKVVGKTSYKISKYTYETAMEALLKHEDEVGKHEGRLQNAQKRDLQKIIKDSNEKAAKREAAKRIYNSK